LRPDAGEKLRVGLLDPGELLRRRAGEDEVIVIGAKSRSVS